MTGNYLELLAMPLIPCHDHAISQNTNVARNFYGIHVDIPARSSGSCWSKVQTFIDLVVSFPPLPLSAPETSLSILCVCSYQGIYEDVSGFLAILCRCENIKCLYCFPDIRRREERLSKRFMGVAWEVMQCRFPLRFNTRK